MTRRTGLTGSALTRLLARLTDIDVPESGQAFADRLSGWLDWTDAISLSTALNGTPPTGSPGVRTLAGAPADECRRVRAAMTAAIAEDRAFEAEEFAPYRRRYAARQQAMASGIGALREGLRARLAAASPDMARLAAIDAAMEQALGAHELRLLSHLPSWLDTHFGRLRQAGQADGTAWMDRFREDMHEVLLAELDLRFEPVEGLLAALGPSVNRLR